jgi:uncharacterized metal-binding protein YceD (DUF177 family)
MDALDHYSIPVSGLRNGLHEFNFLIDRQFFSNFQESPLQEGAVSVKLLFDKRPDLYVMTFEIEGTVKTTCDRCLEEFDLPIEDTQALMVKFDDKEWEETDVIYILKGTLRLNVARYIYEFVNLAVPMVKTHDEAGESCDPDMLRFLGEQEKDSTEEPDSNPLRDALKGFNLEN